MTAVFSGTTTPTHDQQGGVMQNLEDRLDSERVAWKPKPGDKLTGEIVELAERVSEFNPEPYPIIVVATDDGTEWVFHGYHTVARRELAAQRPAVHDRIGVKYLGRDEAKGYERYRIVVEHTASKPVEPDWDAIAAQAEAELDETP